MQSEVVSNASEFLNATEQAALKECSNWIGKSSGFIGKAMGFLGKPADMAYSMIPESIRDGMNEAVLNTLVKVREHSKDTVRTKDVYDKLSISAGRDVRTPAQAQKLPIEVVDAAARKICSAHRNLAVVQGGATGLAGLPGLVADIPTLYFLIFRCVEEIAVCYGYPPDNDDELNHVFQIVDVGHYLENDKKRAAMTELESMQDLIRQASPVKSIERTIVAKGLQNLSRQLTLSLLSRKAAQVVVFVGAAVGATVNAALLNDIGDTAYYAYRRRFLLDRADLRKAHAAAAQPEVVPEPPAEPATAPEAPIAEETPQAESVAEVTESEEKTEPESIEESPISETKPEQDA